MKKKKNMVIDLLQRLQREICKISRLRRSKMAAILNSLPKNLLRTKLLPLSSMSL